MEWATVVKALLWIIYCSQNSFAENMAGFRLTVPSEYIAFSGDIPVTYTLPNETLLANGILELRESSSNAEISTLPIRSGVRTETVVFICGSIDKAGVYIVKLLNRKDGDVLAEKNVNVRWPNIQMRIDPDHETSSNDVVMTFRTIDSTKCASLHEGVKYILEMVTFHDHDATQRNVMHDITTDDFNDFKNNPVTFTCDLFDIAGIYQVRLKTTRDRLNPIAESNTMDVTWNSKYAISAIPKSIFPCTNQFAVQYEQPECVGTEDIIRVYREVQIVDSPGIVSKSYIDETRAERGKWEAKFSCEMFDRSALGYCFQYVSTARNEARTQQDSICVQSVYIPVPVVNGAWGEWSSWSDCSTTCRGGKRFRHRLCDNPAPAGGGSQCAGPLADEKSCGDAYCAPPTTPKPVVYTPAPGCECGCDITASTGTIVSSSSCLGLTKWIILAPEEQTITLTFMQYTIDPKNSITKIMVRDGESGQSDLLVNDDGANPPSKVQSSQNKLRVEFVAPYERVNYMYGLESEGFAATFQATGANGTILGSAKNRLGLTMWETAMVVIGTLTFIIIIIAAICFVCYHKRSQKKLKEKLHNANQALLVNGEPPNSPSHSNSVRTSIKGSTNLSFGDPAGGSPERKSAQRDYIVAKSVPTSPVDIADIDIDVKHRKKDGSSRGRKRGDPNSPSKHVRLSKSLSNGLSSPNHKHVSATVHSSNAPQHSSPTYVNQSSQQYNPNSDKPVSPRNDTRNKSFISAVKRGGPNAAPMAGEEELSPTTPTNPAMHQFKSVTRHPPGESIPMESFYTNQKHPYHGYTQETNIYEQRPPTEGRDSFTHKRSQEHLDDQSAAISPMHPFKPSKHHSQHYVPPIMHKPELKPLPLRSIQRPDGQSPDQKQQTGADLSSPYSQVSSELSPVLHKTDLFPSRNASQLDLPIDPDFEYDDSIYVSDLPGSYFNMDPGAYTLTWQQHPQWKGKSVEALNSQKNLNANSNGSFC